MQGEISGILDYLGAHTCINDHTMVNLLLISSIIMLPLWLFSIITSKCSDEGVARGNNRNITMIAWDIQQQWERIQHGKLFFMVFIFYAWLSFSGWSSPGVTLSQSVRFLQLGQDLFREFPNKSKNQQGKNVWWFSSACTFSSSLSNVPTPISVTTEICPAGNGLLDNISTPIWLNKDLTGTRPRISTC